MQARSARSAVDVTKFKMRGERRQERPGNVYTGGFGERASGESRRPKREVGVSAGGPRRQSVRRECARAFMRLSGVAGECSPPRVACALRVP